MRRLSGVAIFTNIQHSEIGYRVRKTTQFVSERLASFGINHIETGIAETGIVALIQGESGDGPTVGLRADMDALAIREASNKPWSSTTGERMVQEGIMDRFGISRVFGMHNRPGVEVGDFTICDGPRAAALDEFDIVVKDRGGHAAQLHRTIDPIVVAAQIIVGLQTLVSRNTDPTGSLVISVTKLNAGTAYSIIPESAELAGTVRTLLPSLRDFAERQIEACARVSPGDRRGSRVQASGDLNSSCSITLKGPTWR